MRRRGADRQDLLFLGFASVTRFYQDELQLRESEEMREDRAYLERLRAEAEMRVDGSLDEPAWQAAPPVGDFWQRELAELLPHVD